ncbi:hypothetical protein CPAR01_04067 [Colletotrichum paranaense]|uniref:Uncharacterized protein n=2 Tax=Colletotrichum acutatum species complex TaxID=2707335 RepID=A0AAI9Y310_9PEZI|nr:uncharacterized protein CPAR01_04067 [Colletotrichum paranaense]KAK1468942.1 hypothetical protein CMEL01_00709 [Colletotrichum melonis]KAK1543434.1 hypothetical protein CPAR01_04067 [Colletotrichum paranaense]
MKPFLPPPSPTYLGPCDTNDATVFSTIHRLLQAPAGKKVSESLSKQVAEGRNMGIAYGKRKEKGQRTV